MTSRRRKLEELLWVTDLHTPARWLHRATKGRNRNALYQSIREFYRQLIDPGSLVFDVGANVGLLAEVFASLGCRVVAVEPNADCARHIEIAYAGNGVETIQAAVGPKSGLAVLNVSDRRDDISSLSPEWMDAIGEKHPEYGGLWSRKVRVPMITLDSLAESYGTPDFIKIDVEGYEEFVLEGLSAQPKLMSFEFNTAFRDATLRCLNNKVVAIGSVFNYTMGDPIQFELPEWVPKDGMIKSLASLGDRDQHGDIFVRRPVAGLQPVEYRIHKEH